MEGFFYECCAVGEKWDEVLEFTYRTYATAEAILAMPWRIGARLVSKGREEARRGEYWALYCSMYPHMGEENFVQFSTWYESLMHPQPKQTKSEIMSNVETIINMTVR